MLRNLSGTQRYALFVLLVVVVVVIYLFVSGGFRELTGGGDDDEQTQAEQIEAIRLRQVGELISFAQVPLGDRALVGNVEISVQGITYPDQVRIAGFWRQPAERYGQLLLRVTNRGSASVLLPLEALQLVSSDGRSFIADAEVSAGAAAVTEGAVYAAPVLLQPGLTVTVLMIYELPNDAGGLQLRATGAWFDFALREAEE